jgi:hypothetical protein
MSDEDCEKKDSIGCNHTYTRGDRKGQSCGKKVFENRKCKTHQNIKVKEELTEEEQQKKKSEQREKRRRRDIVRYASKVDNTEFTNYLNGVNKAKNTDIMKKIRKDKEGYKKWQEHDLGHIVNTYLDDLGDEIKDFISIHKKLMKSLNK